MSTTVVYSDTFVDRRSILLPSSNCAHSPSCPAGDTYVIEIPHDHLSQFQDVFNF